MIITITCYNRQGDSDYQIMKKQNSQTTGKTKTADSHPFTTRGVNKKLYSRFILIRLKPQILNTFICIRARVKVH